MRYLLLCTFYCCLIPSFAQTFNLEEEWFENSGFFESDFIQSKKIRTISISVRKKLDGSFFQFEKPLLHYQFNAKGDLINSNKYIRLNNRIDTATYQFTYDQKGRLIQRLEKQGPFHFGYHFEYTNNYLEREIKTNELTKDTSYQRYYSTTIQGKEKKLIHMNSVKKPFCQSVEKRSSMGLLLYENTTYYRNNWSSEVAYTYREGKLIEKLVKKLNQSQQTAYRYDYEGNQLQLVRIKAGEQGVKKLAFTYNEQGIPQEIIERDMIELSIKIYRLEYSYY